MSLIVNFFRQHSCSDLKLKLKMGSVQKIRGRPVGLPGRVQSWPTIRLRSRVPGWHRLQLVLRPRAGECPQRRHTLTVGSDRSRTAFSRTYRTSRSPSQRIGWGFAFAIGRPPMNTMPTHPVDRSVTLC